MEDAKATCFITSTHRMHSDRASQALVTSAGRGEGTAGQTAWGAIGLTAAALPAPGEAAGEMDVTSGKEVGERVGRSQRQCLGF